MASNFIRGAFDPLETHPAVQLGFNGEDRAIPNRVYTQEEKDAETALAFHKIVGFAFTMKPTAVLDLGITDSDRLKWLVEYIERLDNELRAL